MVKQKVSYLLSSMLKHLTRTGFSCPSCGNAESALVDKKYLVATLRRCKRCRLLFVAPTSSPQASANFYQKRYTQGFTTELPTPAELAAYCSTGFQCSDRDYGHYVDIIGSVVCPGSRVFDFGCSWGYGSWQILNAGFHVESYEISVPRADFARKRLGIDVHSSLEEVRGDFDVFFSSHVLEHVPCVSRVIEFGFSILKAGGIFLAVTPNGSAAFRKQDQEAWHMSWGKVHPNLLDDVFYQAAFAETAMLLASNPYSLGQIREWMNEADRRPRVHDLNGSELLVMARKQLDYTEATQPESVSGTRAIVRQGGEGP